MLIRLKKAQSTAEYALVIVAVIAFLAAGQVLLKGALKKKAQQAISFYDDQNGTGSTIDLADYGEGDTTKYERSYYETDIDRANYMNERITHKGGEEERLFRQEQRREGVSIEDDVGVDSEQW